MRVFVIGTRGFPGVQGGVEKYCEELFPRIAKYGVDVTVFTRTPYLKKPYRKEWRGVKFINLWCPRQKYLEAIVHTLFGVTIAALKAPEILHFNAIGPSILIPFAKKTGLKVVMTHHGPDYERAKWGSFAKSILKLGEKWGCKYADEIISVSLRIKELIKNKYNREAHFIPNGVTIPSRRKESYYIRSIGLEPKKYVLAVARFVPEKGLDCLISAFSRLRQNDWKLVIAGDADHETPYSRKLKALAKRAKRVVLTGFVKGEPLEELYSHAGLFVLPSFYEGLPIALLEALSYGLSVIASDIPANKELGLHESRYFKAGDELELCERINYWISKGPLEEKEEREQIELLKRRYNWETIAEQTMGVYERVVNA